mgnify:CR=1 FL=1
MPGRELRGTRRPRPQNLTGQSMGDARVSADSGALLAGRSHPRAGLYLRIPCRACKLRYKNFIVIYRLPYYSPTVLRYHNTISCHMLFYIPSITAYCS